MQRKWRSGIQAAASRFCCLSGAPATAYCLLAADSICRNLKDLLHRLPLLLAPSRFARLGAFGRRAQAIHHQAVYRYDTAAVETSRQNRTSRRSCQISPTEKKLTNLYYHTEINATFFITIKSAPSGRIAHSVFRRSAALFSQKVHKVHKVHTFLSLRHVCA